MTAPLPQTIFNLDDSPFASFEIAAKMRDLLIQETGKHYQVDKYENGNFVYPTASFVVVAKAQDTENTPRQMISDIKHLSDVAEIQPKIYRQSLRTWLLQMPLLLTGLLLMVFPLEILVCILKLLHIQSLPVSFSSELLVNITQWTGIAISIIITAIIAIPFFGTQFVVGQTGITLKQGIIARETLQVRFSEIRTIGMKQGIFDRLLNIGLLEFTSAGSDGVDIRFHNIANPKSVRDTLQTYVNQQH